MPDVDWCLHAVSALNPQHEIFDPDYLPSKSQRGRRGIRYIPKPEDFIFQEPPNFNPAYSKNQFNGSMYTQEKPKDRNVTFQQYGSKVTVDHLGAAGNYIFTKPYNKMNGKFQEQYDTSSNYIALTPINVNHFDLSLDDSASYVNIQSNEYSKKKNDPQAYEEEKTYDEDVVSITKFKKSQTETKSKSKNISSDKIGGLFQMLQNLESRGLLPQEMQPYLEYYHSYNQFQKADFGNMPSKAC
jgi:hypothetical protein